MAEVRAIPASKVIFMINVLFGGEFDFLTFPG